MAEFNEVDHLFDLEPNGIKRFDGSEGMNNRIADWLITPEGTVADNPGWGNPLLRYQHEPQSATLEVEIQLALVRKIRRDVKDITVRGIDVRFVEKDLCHLTIWHNTGVFNGNASLSGEGVTSGII